MMDTTKRFSIGLIFMEREDFTIPEALPEIQCIVCDQTFQTQVYQPFLCLGDDPQMPVCDVCSKDETRLQRFLDHLNTIGN